MDLWKVGSDSESWSESALGQTLDYTSSRYTVRRIHKHSTQFAITQLWRMWQAYKKNLWGPGGTMITLDVANTGLSSLAQQLLSYRILKTITKLRYIFI
jgi:hypothetical protein